MAWLIGNDLKNDWLIGSSGADTIKGLGGNDTLKGGGGADWIDGGAGIDTAMYVDSPTGVHVELWSGRGYYGTAEGDTLVSIENLYGSSYRDLLFGTEGANELRGLDDDDQLVTYGGNDLLDGGWGDDVLVGGAGADQLIGGEGFDMAGYAASPAGITVFLASGTAYGGDAEGDRLSGIEHVEGSFYNDSLYGGSADDYLVGWRGDDYLKGAGGNDSLLGGDGQDSLFGGIGNDHIYGDEGDDRLDGGAGADTLSGDAGYDWASYEGSSAGVIVSLATGRGYGGDAEGDYLYGIEGLHGSAYNDVLYGDAGNSIFNAGDGADTLHGESGDDKLEGQEGNDWLYGGMGNDRLYGGAGEDWLEGGLGTDRMGGGTGADTFAWSSIDHMPTAWPDYILDFNRGEGDRLHLAAIDANPNAPGNQAFQFIGTAAFSGAPGEVRYYHLNGETVIELQTNGSPEIEGAIRLLGTFTPDASWFGL